MLYSINIFVDKWFVVLNSNLIFFFEMISIILSNVMNI